MSCFVEGNEADLVLVEHDGETFRIRGVTEEESSLAWAYALKETGTPRPKSVDEELPHEFWATNQRYLVLFGLGGLEAEGLPEAVQERRRIGGEGWTIDLPVTYQNVCKLKPEAYLKLSKAVTGLSSLTGAERKNS
jgi:hypothetical protein